MYKRRLLVSFVLLSLICFGIGSAEAQAWRWTVTVNPSPAMDVALDVAVAPTGMYVVGYDMVGGDARWRIERRNQTTGALLTPPLAMDFSVGDDVAYSVAVDGTGVYIAGYDRVTGNARWRIMKRSLLGLAPIWAATINPSSGTDIAFDVAVRSTGLYVVGSVGQAKWRIERRSPTTGALWVALTSDPSVGSDIPYAVAADGTGVYVAGFDSVGGNARWRIEKRNLIGLGVTWAVMSNPSGGQDIIYDIAVGSTGIYAVGYDSLGGDARWRMERRSTVNGVLLAAPATSDPSAGTDIAYGVAVGTAGVYVVGVDRAAGNNRWRIEKRTLLGLTPMFTVTINPSAGDDTARSVAFDATGFYTVGADQVLGNIRWRMEKRTP